MRPLVVSASWKAHKFLYSHLESIFNQTEVPHVGLFLSESDLFDKEDNEVERFRRNYPDAQFKVFTSTERSCTLDSQHYIINNSQEIIPGGLQDDDVIFWVDGDDRLYDNQTVEFIMSLYKADPNLLLTYGQLVPTPSDSRCPVARPYPFHCLKNNDYRRASKWGHCFNHLRTARYGLWKEIPREYTLTPEGSVMTVAGDAAEVISMLELAGSDRFRFVNRPCVLYTTNNNLSDWRRDPREINRVHSHIESMQKLEPLGR